MVSLIFKRWCSTKIILKVKGRGGCFCNTLYIFSACMVTWDVSSESSDRRIAEGWTSYWWYYRWEQESGTPSTVCSLNVLWPCIIFHETPTQNLLTSFCAEGLNRRKTRQKTYWAILWARAILFFFVLLFSLYSSLFLPAKANKLYQQIQLSNTRPRSIRPETNFGRQQWKKNKNQASSLGREGQNVNFPGKPSLVDWTVKRSSNAHSSTR